MFNRNTSLLAGGMTDEQLRDALQKAQQAYIDLTTGSRGVSFSYTQGDGTRSVSYQQSSRRLAGADSVAAGATGNCRPATEACEVQILMNKVQILGPDGKPYQSSKPRMLTGGSRVPYDAADSFSDQLANWQPALWSPDNEINIYRDRIVSRARDLVRNDGWANGAVTRLLDNAVGANFRPIMKPDYRVLRMMTGNKSFDAVWAEEYGKALASHWRTWAYDTGRYCDVERKLTVPQMLRLAFRHKLIDGDALMVLQYRTDRLGPGKGRYATTVQVVDPDRLSNPQQNFDMPNIRGGVEIDADGAPVAYHIREAHIGDWWSGTKTMTWRRIPRETDWGARMLCTTSTMSAGRSIVVTAF
nr:phage portal protein [Klebsiella quasipneumoniae]